jgi:hypothetical protein
MSKSLSYLSDIATQNTNTTGTTTPILTIDPTNGTLIRLLNMVATGSAAGLPLFMDLNDSGDNDLPSDTEFVLQVERPTDDEPITVSRKEDNIAAWNGLTISEQRNEENIDSAKIMLRGDGQPAERQVNIRDKDVLYVSINSSAQIDWSNSELYFANEAVQELPFSG